MLGMGSNHLTPKIKSSYTDLKQICNKDTFIIYEGKSRATQEVHTLRVLNLSHEKVQIDYDKHATLFIKEMVRIASHSPKALQVILNSFEISEQKMAFASIPYNPVPAESNGNLRTLLKEKDIEKMMQDIIADTELFESLEADCSDLITLDSIYRFKEDNVFFLGGWSEALESDLSINLDQSVVRLRDKPDGVYSLGKIALEQLGLRSRDVEKILMIDEPFIHDSAIKGIIAENQNLSPDTKKLIGQLLTKSPEKRMSWRQLKAEFGSNSNTNIFEETKSNNCPYFVANFFGSQ